MTNNLPTKLYHYSSNPLISLDKDFHEKSFCDLQFYAKPYGLWISVEDDEKDVSWKSWCEGEGFCLEQLEYKYLVKINKNQKILHLKTTEEIIEFSHKYKFQPELFNSVNSFLYYYEINWAQVVRSWDGIIISPYNGECNLKFETRWYYGWDCASGCIWNIEAVESFTLLSTMPPIGPEPDDE